MIRTDVKSYYASIDHLRLIERLARVIQDRLDRRGENPGTN